MHWMDWSGGGWMMIFWWIFIIAIIYLVVKMVSGQRSSEPKQDSAIYILKKRYARGEISKKEFEEKRPNLITL